MYRYPVPCLDVPRLTDAEDLWDLPWGTRRSSYLLDYGVSRVSVRTSDRSFTESTPGRSVSGPTRVQARDQVVGAALKIGRKVRVVCGARFESVHSRVESGRSEYEATLACSDRETLKS